MKLFIRYFSPVSCHFMPFDPTSPSAPYSQTAPRELSLHNVSDCWTLRHNNQQRFCSLHFDLWQ